MRILFLLLVIITNSVYPNSIRFDYISTRDGLSQNTVACITQDKKGFMWFGNEEGLNKYDGHNFTKYKHDPLNPNSLCNNMVLAVFGSKQEPGIIWIGTWGGGLNRFDSINEKFVLYETDPNDTHSISSNYIRTIFEDHKGVIWIGTKDGLNKFDKQNEQFSHYKNIPDNPDSLSSNKIGAIYEDSSGILWIGTMGGGLNRFDPKTEMFSCYKNLPDNSKSLSHNHIRSIIRGESNSLWIGTFGGGLNKFDKKNRTFKRYPQQSHNKNINNKYIRSIIKDKSGYLWIGTQGGGLNKFCIEKEEYTQYLFDPNNNNSLSGDIVVSVYQDRSGVIWIGTYGCGLNKFVHTRQNYDHLLMDVNNSYSQSYNHLISINEEKPDHFWIGTEGGLLNFNSLTNKSTRSRLNKNLSAPIALHGVYSIHKDKSGTLWFGFWGIGLIEYNIEKNIFNIYKNDKNNPDSLSNNEVTSIIENRKGELWIGTWSGELNLFDKKHHKFTRYLPKIDNMLSSNYKKIFCLHETISGDLLIGTEIGLIKFETKSKTFTQFKTSQIVSERINSGRINTIFTDHSQNIWIGTTKGLVQFNQRTEQFTDYSNQCSLPNNEVIGILEDDHSNLWLSTYSDLYKFNPLKKQCWKYNISSDIERFSFTRTNYKSKNGKLYFGGTKGAISFYPEKFTFNQYIPPVVFTSYKRFSRKVKLAEDISEIKELKLSYRDTFISFEFSALCYANPSKNQYAYKIEGLNDEWIYSGNKHEISLAGISPGEYVIKIRGSNSEGIWSNTITSLKLIITPPFWQTWWFISIIVLLVIYLIRKWHQTRMKRLSNKLKKEASLERFLYKTKISKREKEIIQLIIDGKNNQDIENILYISHHTVKNHIYNIFQKLDINSKQQLISLFKEVQSLSDKGENDSI